MEKIILDTNFLLAIGELNLDVFEAIRDACDFPYRIYVLRGTVEELEKLIKGRLLSKRNISSFALKVLKSKDITVLDSVSKGTVDDQLVALDGYVVATVDRELRQRLKAKQRKVLTIRQKRYVVIE